MESAFNFQRKTDNYGKLFSVLPILTTLCPEACDYKIVRESAMIIRQIFKDLLDEQIKTYDENHERHFVDVYIKKWREMERSSAELSTFSCKSKLYALYGQLNFRN